MLTDAVRAYEAVWIIGDVFVANTVRQYLQLNDEFKPYIRDKYDVKVEFSMSLDGVTSVVARVHNNFIRGIEEHKLLPKAIIFIFDCDLIKSVKHDGAGTAEIFGQVLKNLMLGVHRTVQAYKDQLPNKSKRFDYPALLWVEAPLHVNFPSRWNMHRSIFNNCLASLVQGYPEMYILWLKKIWNYDDPALCFDRRITASGLTAYWGSIDSAFRHWDTFISVKVAKKLQDNRYAGKTSSQEQRSPNDFVAREVQKYQRQKFQNKFFWQKRRSQRGGSGAEERRKSRPLPIPPSIYE